MDATYYRALAARLSAYAEVTDDKVTSARFRKRAHAVAVLAVILVGFGMKLYFFSTPTAEADESSVKASGMEVLKMHENIKLPTQKINDMTFVFSEGD
jgi:hypothetical protein